MVNNLVLTDIEAIVFEWLTKRKIPFQFQTSLMGGFYSLGGAVCDFIVEPNLAWRISGEYWHKTVEKIGSDTIQREQLEALGYIVVDLWGSDLLNPDKREEALQLALQGNEMLE